MQTFKEATDHLFTRTASAMVEVREELAAAKRSALMARNDREILMATAKRLLRAIDREPWKGVGDMQDETGRPDRLLRDAVDLIDKRLHWD